MAENIKVVLEKIDKETPLTGNVSNIIDDPYQKENAPSLELMKKAVAARQLLINNDFQINQRGQSSYTFTSLNTYNLDCWFNISDGTAVLEMTDQGARINFTSGDIANIGQRTNIGEIGKTYTVSISYKKNGQQKKITHTFVNISTESQTYRVDGMTVYLWYRKSSNGLAFQIKLNEHMDVYFKYIDLFEGSIAFPHVKEDYSIALMRCSQYVKQLTYNISQNSNASQILQITYPFETPFYSTPTLVILNEGTKSNIRSISEIQDLKRMVVQLQSTNAGTISIYNRKILLSCEPL